MKKRKCCECNKELSKDEVAICKKLINEDTSEYYCLNCFSDYLGCSKDDLLVKISEFKEQGCILFI